MRDGILNVKDYGAKGDWATDDSAAIQAAMDACHAAGGGVVYFPWGLYRARSTDNFLGGGMRDVNKWVWGMGGLSRTVTTRPFGFTRVRTETQRIPDTVRDGDKYVRALNGEPESEVGLDEGTLDFFAGRPLNICYRFSTAALKAELVRRENADARTWPTSSMTGLRGSLGFYDNPPCERRTTERRKAGSDHVLDAAAYAFGPHRKPKKKGKKP